MKNTNWIVSILMVGLIVGILSSCTSKSPETIRVSINSWVGFGPLFVAAENGIFEKNGLKVEIIKLENAPDRRAGLMSNRIDIVGSTLDDLAVTLSQGVDAVAFTCADYSNGSDGIIVGNGINSLEDLVDIPIAVQPGFVNHFFLLYVLDKNGISIRDVKINPMIPDDAGAAFITGSIDAAVTWEPHLTQGLANRNNSKILATSKEYPEAILDIFICNRSWFYSNEIKIQKFKDSWDDALDYMKENNDLATLIIGNELGLDPILVEEMLGGAYLLKSDECSQLLSTNLKSLCERVERIWTEAGYIDNDIKLFESILINSAN